jgi:hypothetical protein
VNACPQLACTPFAAQNVAPIAALITAVGHNRGQRRPYRQIFLMSGSGEPLQHEPKLEAHAVLDAVARKGIAEKLRQYYQLECMHPTPMRLQMLLDELTLRSARKPEE